MKKFNLIMQILITEDIEKTSDERLFVGKEWVYSRDARF